MSITGKGTLPTVRFGKHDITRLIIGGNQIRGFSHCSPELDAEMRDYHSVENTLATWFHCEASGINTVQTRGDEILYERIRAYRERGGTMNWICQTASEHPDTFENIRDIARLNPIGIYYHGSMSDKHWKNGTFDQVEDYLKAIRDTGAMVGIAAHIPEIPYYVEDKGWDVDFYMSCFYNIGKVDRGLVAKVERVEEPFDDEDREVTCEFIRSTDKPCIAYKILAASRKCDSPGNLRAAFKFAFDRIKQIDVVNVGMFQRHTDQVGMNADIVRELLAE
ncbi:MAG: hypothetical protein HRT89_11495 [Lentisphaeria bacterium]|nr:hypothetical protein [Lentisphaeria bacterium]